jgi:hypothetical protein
VTLAIAISSVNVAIFQFMPSPLICLVLRGFADAD